MSRSEEHEQVAASKSSITNGENREDRTQRCEYTEDRRMDINEAGEFRTIDDPHFLLRYISMCEDTKSCCCMLLCTGERIRPQDCRHNGEYP